ncbi:MAG: hypothetical protein COZ15_03860, partial [Elusimicrobia bacterium CG_4_10_14_3_um_filter_49_12_50_7]
GNWAWRMEEIPFGKARGIKKLCRLARRR